MVQDYSAFFQRIFAPVITGVPPCNPHRDFMLMPSGQLRHYGCRAFMRDGVIDLEREVMISDDCGLSWRSEILTAPTAGASVWDAATCRFITVLPRNRQEERHNGMVNLDFYYNIFPPETPDGTYFLHSAAGPDGPFSFVLMDERPLHIQRQLLILRQRRRLLQPFQHRTPDGFIHPGVILSDDEGASWRTILLPCPPQHEISWPHCGFRWRQPGCEPCVAECPEGKLIMLLRTSVDKHYQMISEDGGDSWSEPAESPFYSVATMPNLVTLSDGRMLAVWNNTTPLPELDHELQTGLFDSEKRGDCEDIFTNRDVLHAAISEDSGVSWIGFREILLNECRNEGDFRSSGGTFDSLDKSVHQNEIIELPDNKVIISCGQHRKCRRLLIFDLYWLYEKQRRDDFSSGLGNWSVQQYLKSIHGNYRGIAGHCSLNRRPGATLLPHPDGLAREVLQIARHPDDRLWFEREGAVWNFPAARAGELKMRMLFTPGAQNFQLALTDRWFNPVDPVAGELARFVLIFDRAGRINRLPAFTPGVWFTIRVSWNDNSDARLSVDGELKGSVSVKNPTGNAICYLHLQSLAENSEYGGVMLESVSFNSTPAVRQEHRP